MRNLPFKHVNDKQKEVASKAKPKSLLEAFEYIVELAEDSNLNAEFFEKASTHIKYATRKLKLSEMQVVLLAQFVDRSQDNAICMSEIANYTGCRITRFLRISGDIDVLEEKKYLRASRNKRGVRYRVPADVIKAIRNGQPYTYQTEAVEDTLSFFDRIKALFDEKEADELNYENLTKQIMRHLEEIRETKFARKLKAMALNDEDQMLFIYMAHLFVENSDDFIGLHDIKDMYDDEEIPTTVKRSLHYRSSVLFTRNLIENSNEDGMARADSYRLTSFAKEEVLSELDLCETRFSPKGLIKADSLTPKELVYNNSEIGQINELSSILSKDRFSDVQSRLEKAGMRKGFCCLFYGAPGTGKTETVYQLARQTGRDIMRVDVDKIKSCWVGESEKNIKALFDRYRSICKNSPLAPILLFNEADAVLGVRMEGAARAVDKSENSIQNIILQEMESLEGIMIATTNLTANLDKAFERRFLYKIRFDRPTVESRAKIWEIMLQGLTSKDAISLASQFDLSGGEIENIVRRRSVNSILNGDDMINLEEIKKLCLQEKIAQSSRDKIGFQAAS